MISGEEMSIYTDEDIRQLQHCIYRTFLKNPRMYYDDGARLCKTARNTFTKYWKLGLLYEIFFPPQIRWIMFEGRKEYIYLVQSEIPHKLYNYYRGHPDVVYLSFTLGNFNLFIQTNKPLEVLPDRTLFYGSRGNYFCPETPYYSFDKALDKVESCVHRTHTPSTSEVTYPCEPDLKGSEYGEMIFPYVKYDLRTNYTFIVKKLGLSFSTFYKGFEYLLSVSTVLLPYYPFAFHQYSHNFFVFWTDYEDFIREAFSYLPCHTSIVKVGDALIVYAGLLWESRFYALCYEMLDSGLVKRFWTASPVFHWVPDPP